MVFIRTERLVYVTTVFYLTIGYEKQLTQQVECLAYNKKVSGSIPLLFKVLNYIWYILSCLLLKNKKKKKNCLSGSWRGFKSNFLIRDAKIYKRVV
jgi:hypothetical protein